MQTTTEFATPELHFRGDLWNTTRQQREGIARVIHGDRFHRITESHLTTGLWFYITLTDGSSVMISANQAKVAAWRQA